VTPDTQLYRTTR